MISKKLVAFSSRGVVYNFDYDGANKAQAGYCPTSIGDADIDMANGHIYAVDPTNNKIIRYNADGSGDSTGNGTGSIDVLTQTGVYYVAVDEVNQKLYYSALIPGVAWKIFKANMDGTSAVEILNSTVDGFTNAWGLAISTVERKLFFTDQGSTTKGIWSATLDGDSPTRIITLAYQPSRIALDRHGRKLFWCDAAAPGKIESASTSGGTVTTVASDLGGACSDLAFNEEDGYLYYTRANVIGRVKRDGTGQSTLETDADATKYYKGIVVARQCVPFRPVTVWSGIGDVWACKNDGTWLQLDTVDGALGAQAHVDYVNGYIYFWATDGSIKRSNLDGSSVTSIRTPPAGWELHGGMCVNVTDGYIFYGCWIEDTANVQTRRCSLTGTSDIQICSDKCLDFGAYDSTNNKLYMALYSSYSIYEMNADGSSQLAWSAGNGRYDTYYLDKINGLHYRDGYLYIISKRDWRTTGSYVYSDYVYKVAVNGSSSVATSAWASIPNSATDWHSSRFQLDPDGLLLVVGFDPACPVGNVYKIDWSANADEWIRGLDTSADAVIVQDEIDPALGKIYCIDVTDNEIIRCTPPACDDEEVVTALEHYGSVGDSRCANGWLVWSDTTTNSIIRATCDGTIIQSVWDGLGGQPIYITYDEDNDEVYWVEYDSDGPVYYRIMKGAADGSGSKVEVCNSSGGGFGNCWGLAFVPALAPYPLVIADASQNKLLKTDGTTFSTLRDCGGDPKKIAVDNQSTAAASKIIYGYNADTIRKVDCDGTDDAQLCDINRMPTMLTYNPDDQYVYMLKTSSALAKVKIDGTNFNSALYTWVSHDIRGIAYNPQ